MHTGGGLPTDTLKSGGGTNDALLLVGGGALVAALGSGVFAARRARSRA